MIPALVTALIPTIGKLLDKVLPNTAEKEKFKAELELELMKQENELIKVIIQSDLAQAEINKIEAGSENLFKSGWRPMFAWVCVAGFTWATLLQPMIVFVSVLTKNPVVAPAFETDILMQALFGLLGLGGFRMMEKKWGVASK